MTSWTIAYQAPQSMEFSRQEYWSGLPFPSPGDLPNPGIEPGSPTLQVDTLPSEPPGKSSLGGENSKGLGRAQSGRQNFQEVVPEDLTEKVTFEGDFPGGPVVSVSNVPAKKKSEI